MKGKITTIILILLFLIGVSLLLYPTVSDYWNSLRQSRAIVDYLESVSNIDTGKYEAIMDEAKAFNEELKLRRNWHVLEDEHKEQYKKMLSVSEDGIMGYIEVPEINCNLPIYHGTDESVLQIAIGHLEWTHLPVGGEGTHSVLSGHRGLPSAKLFTNLNQLVIGDVFVIRVLNEVLTYEVDQIEVVDPDDTELLKAEEGKDYCTLVTCTPYGVNSHRLLVRGHRIENIEASKTVRVTADAVQISPMMVAPVVAIPIVVIFIMLLLLNDKSKKHGGKEDED